MTDKEVKLVHAVFDELLKIPYEKLNTILGSQTIKEVHDLRNKLHYADYCDARGIKYEDMTDDDFIDAYERMMQE